MQWPETKEDNKEKKEIDIREREKQHNEWGKDEEETRNNMKDTIKGKEDKCKRKKMVKKK